MNRNITLTINGRKKTLSIDIRSSLLEVLRDQLGLTSIKQGCGVGECGACTVIIDGEIFDSCIYLAVWADGKSIRTVEGESRDGNLSAVQQEYVAEGAVQCGFCTPGLVMTTTSLVEKHRGESLSKAEIRRAHAGNTCRCTGYQTILKVAQKCLQPAGEDGE